ncbi:AfsR/SARP family transcriptional regulator [Streptomyces sp. TRM 70351]|uniref:AfsR/SARP family transcriptional regulator n=1 Tax=Streptomyces sp. TRM 70351 TaxID=3116552 RepID=UPI002E7AAFA4|nr:AfsR/SARP family transcriptional regulator [Streptomyces sp. TRM 70351]MEE1929188.1 AfsR/SARP family transcriptional regulator [Streptomyces sp. TRM 70351]
MEVRLLGPVGVVADDGTALPLTASIPRTVLAVLALRPGQTVLADTVIDQVWGTRPPRTARATLRSHVMRLRKILPGQRLHTGAGGYRLAVLPAETDLGRFRDLLCRARQRAADDPAEALALLESSRQLWQGAPLGGVADSPLRDTERPRLEDLALAATEERFVLRLALGQHAAVVEEIAEAAAAHPLRERFAAQLMTALHACGRTAEALVVYRDIRRRLVAELGVEPGAELRRTEQAVLCGEHRAEPAAARGGTGTLAGRPPSRAPEPAAAPPAPPPRVTGFVGREPELERLRGWLAVAATEPVTCLLAGPGGVGKSTLAVRAARLAADRFPDGLLYLDLRGADPHNAPRDPAEALHLLLPALGVPRRDLPVAPADAARLYQERLRGRRCVLVLDNAESAAQVAPLLPEGPGTAALVTSRPVLAGVAHGHHLHVDPVDPAQAVRLVQAVAGSSAGQGTHGQWRKLVALCGHLPLALSIIATRMASRPHWGLPEWIALLEDEHLRTDELTAGRERDVRASLMVTVDQLAGGDDPADRLAAGVFPLLGVAAVRAHTAGSVAALAGVRPAEAEAALERLTDAQVTMSPRPGRYSLHDMVRSVAVWQAARLPRGRARPSLERLARWYAGTLYRVNGPLAVSPWRGRTYAEAAARFPEGEGFADARSALTWADEGLADVMSLAAQTAGEGDEGGELAGRPLSAFAVEACRALESYFGMRLRWREQERLCELALAGALRRGDAADQALALAQLGKLAGQRGDAPRGVGHLERALELYRGLGHEELAMGAEVNLVACLATAGRVPEALAIAERLQRAAHPAVPGAGINLNNLARCHLYLGAPDRAVRTFALSHEVAETAYARIHAAAGLAESHLVRRAYREAARWVRRGLAEVDDEQTDLYTVAHLRTLSGRALRGLDDERGAQGEEREAARALETLSRRESREVAVQLAPVAEPAPC